MAKSYGKIYQHKNNVSITPFDIYNLYPVGSIYISVNSTNPSNYFGGTWERIKGKFLLAADDNIYKLGDTGGEAKHKLTKEELPKIDINTAYAVPSTSGGDGTGLQFGKTNGNSNNVLVKNVNYGDKAHNNMPPYLVVYIWKRVA